MSRARRQRIALRTLQRMFYERVAWEPDRRVLHVMHRADAARLTNRERYAFGRLYSMSGGIREIDVVGNWTFASWLNRALWGTARA